MDKKINTRSIKYLDYRWGLGAEHEMQLFHINRNSENKYISDSNVIFDSQESTCLLTYNLNKNNQDSNGTCCKAISSDNKCYHNHPEIKKILPKNNLDSNDLEFLNNVPWLGVFKGLDSEVGFNHSEEGCTVYTVRYLIFIQSFSSS